MAQRYARGDFMSRHTIPLGRTRRNLPRAVRIATYDAYGDVLEQRGPISPTGVGSVPIDPPLVVPVGARVMIAIDTETRFMQAAERVYTLAAVNVDAAQPRWLRWPFRRSTGQP